MRSIEREYKIHVTCAACEKQSVSLAYKYRATEDDVIKDLNDKKWAVVVGSNMDGLTTIAYAWCTECAKEKHAEMNKGK